MLYWIVAVRSFACALIASVAMLCCSPIAAADEAIEAVWKPQRISFVFVGYTTQYTCHALEDKLKLVLLTLGAHDEIVVDRTRCSDASRRLDVTFKSPVVATAENIELITTYDAKEALVARLNEQRQLTPEDLVRFSAQWQDVSFARHRKLRMGSGDCEFVDHVRRTVLPTMSVRVITNRLFCTPGYSAITPPRLTVSALVQTENSTPGTN